MIIYSKRAYSYFYSADRGEVFGFGAGNYGQLGTGTIINKTNIVLAKALSGKHISFIAAGPSHSIAISNDGKVNQIRFKLMGLIFIIIIY